MGTKNNYAGLGVRVIAFVIDLVIVLGLYALLVMIIGLPLMRIMSLPSGAPNLAVAISLFLLLPLFIWFGYFTYFIGKTGQTVGKSILKIRVVGKDDKPIGFLKAFLRTLVLFILNTAPIVLLHLWIIFDKNKQGIHDKIIGSYVISLSKNERQAE